MFPKPHCFTTAGALDTDLNVTERRGHGRTAVGRLHSRGLGARNWQDIQTKWLNQRFYKYVKIPQLSTFACTVHLAQIVNNGVVFCYPSRCSIVYNTVVSWLAAAECTLWEWAWLAKNCARVKCRLKERADLFFINPPSLAEVTNVANKRV